MYLNICTFELYLQNNYITEVYMYVNTILITV